MGFYQAAVGQWGCDENFLRVDAEHSAQGHPAVTDTVRYRHIEFRPHHVRQFWGIAHHHGLGQAGGGSLKPVGRSPDHLFNHLPQCSGNTVRIGCQRTPSRPRPEERREGKECGGTSRYWWARLKKKKKKHK